MPNVAHKQWWQIFEVVFGVPFLVAIGLHFILPFSLPTAAFMPIFVFVGISFVVLGVLIVVLARHEFARQKQPTDPGRPTSKLITSGVFAFSRNPLYLGGVCVLLGISLIANMPWGLVFLLFSLIACHIILIAPEERYLAATFGEEYQAYAVAVHRWFGRTRA